jgi:hypothetical protein
MTNARNVSSGQLHLQQNRPMDLVKKRIFLNGWATCSPSATSPLGKWKHLQDWVATKRWDLS